MIKVWCHVCIAVQYIYTQIWAQACGCLPSRLNTTKHDVVNVYSKHFLHSVQICIKTHYFSRWAATGLEDRTSQWCKNTLLKSFPRISHRVIRPQEGLRLVGKTQVRGTWMQLRELTCTEGNRLDGGECTLNWAYLKQWLNAPELEL